MAAVIGPKADTAPVGSAIGGFSTHRLALVLLLAVLLAWGALLALAIRSAVLPDSAAGTVIAVFPPDMPPIEMLSAIQRADGILAGGTWLPNAWIVYSSQVGLVGRLKAAGAWIAFAPPSFDPAALGGCFAVPARVGRN